MAATRPGLAAGAASYPNPSILHRGYAAGSGGTTPTIGTALLSVGGTLPVGTAQYYAVAAVLSGGGLSIISGLSAAVTPTSGNQTITPHWSIPSFTVPAGQTLSGFNVYRGTSGTAAGLTFLAFVSGASATSYTDTGGVALGAGLPPQIDTTAYLGTADTSDPSTPTATDTNVLGSLPVGSILGPGVAWVDFDVALLSNGGAASLQVMPMFYNARTNAWYPSAGPNVIAPLTVSATYGVTYQSVRLQLNGRPCYLKATSLSGPGAAWTADAITVTE